MCVHKICFAFDKSEAFIKALGKLLPNHLAFLHWNALGTGISRDGLKKTAKNLIK